MEPLSLTFPFFSIFPFLWITLNRIFKKEEASSLFPTCHMSFPLFFSFTHLFLLISLRHISLFTISIFSLFHLGSFSGFNNHLINIKKKISRKIPKLAQLYPEYIIIFIIIILGYFLGVTLTHKLSKMG